MTFAYPRARDQPFVVLMVCTGNVARSPLAEQLFAARVASIFGPEASASIVVSSAGVNALVGDDMTAKAQRVARNHGVEPTPHRARQLDRELVAGADLVLGANRAHRRFVVETVPRASRTAFTIAEFAHVTRWLASEAAQRGAAPHPVGLVDRLLAVRDTAARVRGVVPPPADPSDYDVRDPYRRSSAVYDRVGAIISDAVTSIASDLHDLARNAEVSGMREGAAVGFS